MRNTLLAATAALVLAAVPAMASPTYEGTFTITDTSSGNNGLSVSALPASFSWDLSSGFLIDNGLSTVVVTDNNTHGTQTDTIMGTFAFTVPDVQTNSQNGAVTETVTFGGFFSNGQITWNLPAVDINFNNGSEITVALSQPAFNNIGTSNSGTINALITLDKGPTSVPEPLSLSLLGSGLVGLGMVRRRRASKA